MKPAHNKLFLSDQGKFSRRLLAQPPRQSALAPEQERYKAQEASA
jgi:hypothetical protein